MKKLGLLLVSSLVSEMKLAIAQQHRTPNEAQSQRNQGTEAGKIKKLLHADPNDFS